MTTQPAAPTKQAAATHAASVAHAVTVSEVRSTPNRGPLTHRILLDSAHVEDAKSVVHIDIDCGAEDAGKLKAGDSLKVTIAAA